MQEKRKKKILYLITKSNWGGAQRYVYDLATSLDSEKYGVTVALGGNGQLVEELTKKGIRIIHLTNLERDISLLREVRSALELFTLLRRERPDILHINSSKAGGLGAVLGRMLRIPHVIFTAHGWAFNESRPMWQKTIITVLHWITVLCTHTTIAVSEVTKSQLRFPFVQHKMHVIHNGRTIAHFKPRDEVRKLLVEKEPSLAPFREDFWSVTIAELHPIKQHHIVIEALQEVAITIPTFRHIIIGAGEEREKLATRIVENGLQEHVFLLGSLQEAALYLKGFDLFVLGSKSEGLAYVLIEASMACLPIIASNVGGIPEVISRPEYGCLCKEGDSKELAHRYLELLNNPAQREELGKKACVNAGRFTFEEMFRKTVALYEAKGSRAS